MSESVEEMNAIKAAKTALRKGMTSTMNNMSLAECKQQSDIVQQKVVFIIIIMLNINKHIIFELITI